MALVEVDVRLVVPVACMIAWLLFLLIVGSIVAYCVWEYRRKAAERAAASMERFSQMFEAKASAAPAPPKVIPVAAERAVPGAPPAKVSALHGRERFLGKAETLLYYLLKTGIPGHEVFANVTLATVIEGSGGGFEQEQQLRNLSQCRLDFVVCDKNMRVVAAVELEAPGGADAAGAQRFKSDSLRTAGVRLIRINLKALPRREEMRILVCGPDAPGT